MHIDISQFPMVWMSSDLPSNWQPVLDALLDREQRFVILTREIPGREGAREARKEERRSVALWFKKNRAQLKRQCAGSIVIVTSEAIARSLGVVLAPLGKAFGYPVHAVVENRVETTVNQLLNNNG